MGPACAEASAGRDETPTTPPWRASRSQAPVCVADATGRPAPVCPASWDTGRQDTRAIGSRGPREYKCNAPCLSFRWCGCAETFHENGCEILAKIEGREVLDTLASVRQKTAVAHGRGSSRC